MIFAIISAWLAYRKAKDSGRSPILWAAIAAATFIGTQLAVQFAIGIFLGVGVAAFGWSENAFETYSIPSTLVAVVASFGSTWLVLHYLDRIPEDATAVAPPPPPNFDRDN